MGNFTELFKNSLPNLSVLSEKQAEKITGNITVGMIDGVDENFHAMQELIAQLALRHIGIGKYITNGNCAYLFEVINDKGQVVPEAVVRIEPIGTHGDTESAGMIRPILKLDNQEYVASIVPKGVMPEWPMDLNGNHRVPEKAFESKDLMRTLSVLSNEGKVDQITDMEVGQIMALPRVHKDNKGKLITNGDVIRYSDKTPAGFLVDLNSIKFPKLDDKGKFTYDPKTGEKLLQESGIGLGSLTSFCKRKGLNRDEIMATKASPEEVKHLREEQDKLNTFVADKLTGAGINLDAPPSKITPGALTAAGEPEQAYAR